jgi:hypothetical protein
MRCALLLLLALACKGEQSLGPGAPTDGQRVDLPIIEFNLWTDFLAIQAALDDECRFMDPLIEDSSTVWPPLQVFWVIYDNEKDVKDGTVIEDIYFHGDEVPVEGFPRRMGKDPLGYLYIGSLQRSFLNIEETSRDDGGRTIEAVLGNPIDTVIRAEARKDETGSCVLETLHCDSPCDGEFEPYTSIFMELGFLFAVQSITFRSD